MITAILLFWFAGMPVAYFVCLVLIKMGLIDRLYAPEMSVFWPVSVVTITLKSIYLRLSKAVSRATTWTANRLQRNGETDAETLLRASEGGEG